jgi:hypothetical protein
MLIFGQFSFFYHASLSRCLWNSFISEIKEAIVQAGVVIMIIDKILEESRTQLEQRRVADVRVGLGYTAVLLDDGGCGLAGTVVEGADWGCTVLPEAGELVGLSALHSAELALSTNSVAASVGVATVNAVLNRSGNEGPDLLEVLPVSGAVVGMVGHFRPFVKALREKAAKLHIFERQPDSPEIHPDWAAERILPECDVVIITSLTLVNKTLDHLVELTKGEIALIGPTTPLSSVFASHGISHLFGMVVSDVQQTLAIVSQAGGTQRFKRATKKVYVKLG